MLYNSLVDQKYTQPIGINIWTKNLKLDSKPNMSFVNDFIFKFLRENKMKMFRWKLLNYIIPTKQLLFKWKISTNSKCNFCQTEEGDYFHFFITCSFLKDFWDKVEHLLAQLNFKNKISVKQLVFGYKISDQGYNGLNYFLTILGFCIYKSYYVSEQKLKFLDVYAMFIKELRRFMNENKTISHNVFFIKLKRLI